MPVLLLNVKKKKCSSGSVAGFYQWSRGVQIRANLDLLMDWIQSIGLGDLATEFFQKLSAAVNLLATPKETLLQVRGHPFLLSCLSSRVESCLRQPECFHCLKGVSTTLVIHVYIRCKTFHLWEIWTSLYPSYCSNTSPTLFYSFLLLSNIVITVTNDAIKADKAVETCYFMVIAALKLRWCHSHWSDMRKYLQEQSVNTHTQNISWCHGVTEGLAITYLT